jgi:hypothetical protein
VAPLAVLSPGRKAGRHALEGLRIERLKWSFMLAAATTANRRGSYRGSFQSVARLSCALARKLAEKLGKSRRKRLEETYELALFHGSKRHFSTPRAAALDRNTQRSQALARWRLSALGPRSGNRAPFLAHRDTERDLRQGEI